jgi:molybdate transport system ATP-binding protein
VVTVAGKMSSGSLFARVQREFRERQARAFVLDVTIEAPPGITILFGPSGAGKSTLLDCIAGLQKPELGKIAVADSLLFDSTAGVNLPAQERHIAYVFQSLALFPHMTALQNVSYGLSKLPTEERNDRATEALRMFRVSDLANKKAGEISGGEQQRVALARSLVTQPQALLLDEPLTGLDAELKASIIDDLRGWNAARRIPILYVTHSRDEVDALGERVIALDHGRIMSQGTPLEVLNAPRRKRLAQAAGFENVLTGTVLDLRETDGVMRVRLGQSTSEIEVPLGHAVPGDTVHVAVRAGDILLATALPHGLSARNVLEGKIISLERRGTLVVARVESGVTFTVHVTPGAERALELAVGKRVWLVLKTHSCHFVEV